MTKPNDLWDDMATLNSLYSELCGIIMILLSLHLIMKMIEL